MYFMYDSMNEFYFGSTVHSFIYAMSYEIKGELFKVLKNSA